MGSNFSIAMGETLGLVMFHIIIKRPDPIGVELILTSFHVYHIVMGKEDIFFKFDPVRVGMTRRPNYLIPQFHWGLLRG
jgi:hypothetical protein